MLAWVVIAGEDAEARRQAPDRITRPPPFPQERPTLYGDIHHGGTERHTHTLPMKSADCGECAEAPPPAPDGYANAVSAAPEERQNQKRNEIAYNVAPKLRGGQYFDTGRANKRHPIHVPHSSVSSVPLW
jgi:hypothetical protein